MPAIPVEPFVQNPNYDPNQEFENEMESKKGLFHLKDILFSQNDATKKTAFQDLYEGAGNISNKAKPLLIKFLLALGLKLSCIIVNFYLD